MLKNIVPTFLAATLLAACVAPTDGPLEEERTDVADDALRNGIILWFIEYDDHAGAFDVGVEVDGAVLADPNARFLIAQLYYSPPRGAGVSPFSATPMDQIDFVAIGRNKYRAVVHVEGPAPSDIDDVVARLSGAPTPHP